MARDDFRLLLAVDDPDRLEEIEQQVLAVSTAGFAISCSVGLENALIELSLAHYDALLLDVSSGSVLDALSRVRVATSELPVLVMASPADRQVALEAVRMGAQDFLHLSELGARELEGRIRFAVERHQVLASLREERARAYRSSLHDTLTGLPNREHFLEQLDRALAYAQRHESQVAVVFIDLDRFKGINDTLGHAAGDQLLIDVASRLKPIIRRSDLLGRLGGDEFIAFIQDANPEGVATLARRVLERLREPHDIEGNHYWVTASLGIALGKGGESQPATLIRNADAAMYEAKALGKNQVAFYSEVMGEAAQRRIQLEQKLRRAFHGGELQVHFQPRVDLRDGQIHGAEALLRWSDPELGAVAPSEFVAAAEANGLIVAMGRWVLETACAEARRWHDEGFDDVAVMVNVSAVQIQRESLRSSVIDALEKAQLPSSALEIEITESALMRDEQLARVTLRELRELGVSLSLDDFGTGYSSLRNLREFPMDAVKIDRSFVQLEDTSDATIVSAILSMVQELGLRVIAEGVETEAQADFLRQRGCLEAQGYLFGAALSGDDFLELLRRTRAARLIDASRERRP